MGNCTSRNARMAQARSDAIDQQIGADSCKFKRECKILLLGSGESGMSTIVKQMKIVHQDGFNRDELMSYRMSIYHNLLDSAQAIILAMREIGLDCEIPSNRMNCNRITDYRITMPTVPLKKPKTSLAAALTFLLSTASFHATINYSLGPNAPDMHLDDLSGSIDSADVGEGFVFDPEIASMIAQLWEDPIMDRVMDHSSEFYLMDSAQYFFENAVRIGKPGYVPSESDVLRACKKSTAITETRFNMGQLGIHMLDVSGLHSERKKWIHCFEDATSIIFCAALSDYDQVLPWDQNTTRMVESLVLFESILNSRWFRRTSVILFLTKFDAFKAKLAKVPLERYFPEYTAGPDVNKAAKYILWRFMQANRGRLSVYPHLTQEGDTMCVRLVFAAVKETILQSALKDSGIL
ncbi:guanine nucleotide binding protein, alpha subunit [Athelia psychrophila]|uniref:Guanine nucleotide binding protein, alpha subunit n=1 Tax=Athelia psychrophila TaxID=1759441 RepID=A0A166PR64_9AGAM|nr:guanine nucleotide binding protein, alpha subunit [Fibularhizoctonia sp. CBS 109695]